MDYIAMFGYWKMKKKQFGGFQNHGGTPMNMDGI